MQQHVALKHVTCYYCLRSRPGDPDIVRQLVENGTQMTQMQNLNII